MRKKRKETIAKNLVRFAVLLICLASMSGIPAAAFTSYISYIYTFDSYPVEAPDAYVPEREIKSEDIGLHFLNDIPLDGPQDLFVDNQGYLYIADQKNNRIVMMNPDYTGRQIFSDFINIWGVPDSLAEPRGVFATDREVYVADTEKNRLVVFDKDGNHLRIIEEPTGDVFPEGHVYKPIAVVVDKSGRIYVVSSTTNQGIIAMAPNGEFQGFVGAQKAVVSPFMIFWRNFQTREMRQRSIRNVATEYNNVAIDGDGFVFATTSSIEPGAQLSALLDKSSDYSPIKRLNPQGADVLRRMGFTGPDGEAQPIEMTRSGRLRGVSRIIDVAIGPEGTWTIIDEIRSRAYTYDEDGRLLFIFGDDGQYFGNIQSVQSVAYQGSKILLLDKTNSSFTVYKRTEYGDVLLSAIANQRNRQYDRSVADWREILKRNNNSDLAYIGIGRSLYRDGEYQDAMRQFRFALDQTSYSQSFKMYRQIWIQNNVIVIPIVLAVLIVGIMLFMKNATKVNTRDNIRSGRKLKLASHMLYGFHIIFHPFDGFWDMKQEKRGSVIAATIYLLLACGVYIYKAFGEGFIVNAYGAYSDFLAESLSIIIPVTLWVISNWCLTTLFDGEGSMKDIYMVTCYALIPIIIIVFFSTLATHIIIEEELPILNMLGGVMFIWVGALLFFGVMVVHDYSLGKNFLTLMGSVVGMAFIMFVTVLFSSLLLRMVQFISSIYTEVTYRL
ncbi:MAG: YIP1 family protein [Oscillospiraceae bacterium]|nr:YIP1 family protein [Oscillospiraceae bacterium]